MRKPIDLWRAKPLSRDFGADRGTPVDRWYVERFLAERAGDIHGRVLEMGDRIYTLKYGRGVTQSDVLYQRPGKPGATIIDDLQVGTNIPSDAFDCVIFTQTFQVIYDSRATIANLHRILKPGGVLLATFPCISPLCRDVQEQWWDYWRLSARAAGRLFGESFGDANVAARAEGNPLVACAFIMGVTLHEMSYEELTPNDNVYETSILLRAVKAGGGAMAAARPARAAPPSLRPDHTVRLGDAGAAFGWAKHAVKADVTVGASRLVGRMAADQWGFLAATEASLTLPAGGVATAARAAGQAAGAYYCPAALLTATAGEGDLPGAGGIEAAVLAETLVDTLALKAKTDPLAFRRQNALRWGTPTATDHWLTSSIGLRPCLDALAPAWAKWRAAAERFNATNKTGKRRGVGLAAVHVGLGAPYGGDAVGVRLQRRRDGTVGLEAPGAGRDLARLLAVIVARVLGVPKTGVAAAAAGKDGGDLLFAYGIAAERAAIALLAKPGAATAEGTYAPAVTGPDGAGLGTPFGVYGFAAVLAEVEVDIGRGTLAVRRLDGAVDVGFAVDAKLQGRRAEKKMAEGLVLALGGPSKAAITCALIEDPEPQAAFGAKSLGDTALLGVAPALLNAFRHTTGVPLKRLPALPEAVAAALKRRR